MGVRGFRRFPLIFASLLAVAIIAGCAAQSQLKRADSLAERGRYEDAIKLYQQIISANPNSDDARKAKLEIGDIYFKKMNKTDEGLKLYQELAGEYPGTEEGSEALWNVAGYYYKQGDYDKAIEIFKEIVEKFKQTKRAGNAQYMIAKCYELKAQKLEESGANAEEIETTYSKAAEEYGKLVTLFPDHSQVPQALRNRGNILERLNRADEAIEAYKQLVQKYSESPETKAVINEVTEKLKQMGIEVDVAKRTKLDSERSLRQAMAERRRKLRQQKILRDVPPDQRDIILGKKKPGPGGSTTGSQSAIFHSSFGVNPDDLMNQIGFSMDNQGTLYDAMYMFANMYYSEGKYKEAGALYERAISLGLKDPQAFVRLAMCYKHEGMEDKAQEMFTKAARKDPKVIDAMITTGQRRYENEEYDKAMEIFEFLLGLVPSKDPDVYYNIGLTYRKMKQNDKAIEAFERAVAKRPNFTDALQHLAELYYYKKGDRELGLAYSDAAGDKSYSYEPQKALGDLCFRYGSYNWARIKYRTAARLAPSPELKLLMNVMAAVSTARKGELGKAQEEINNLAQQNPDAAAIHYGRGEIAMAQNDPQTAIAEFKKALELDPSLSYAAAALGDLYIKGGQNEEALKLWNSFLEKNPKDRLIRRRLQEMSETKAEAEAK
jgi:tetratricopeptide (TPR) repeat protein